MQLPPHILRRLISIGLGLCGSNPIELCLTTKDQSLLHDYLEPVAELFKEDGAIRCLPVRMSMFQV